MPAGLFVKADKSYKSNTFKGKLYDRIFDLYSEKSATKKFPKVNYLYVGFVNVDAPL